MFPDCVGSAVASSCPLVSNCTASDQYYCPFTDACTHTSIPCQCNSTICTNSNAPNIQLEVVAQVAVSIPAGSAASFMAEFDQEVFVQPYDILGIQSQAGDPGLCSTETSDPWTQVAFYSGTVPWASVNGQVRFYQSLISQVFFSLSA